MTPSCTIGHYLVQASQEDAQALLDAVAAQARWNDISLAFRAFGVPISAYALSRHFRGICYCGNKSTITHRKAPTSLSEALKALRS